MTGHKATPLSWGGAHFMRLRAAAFLLAQGERAKTGLLE
jgi:hypothetical protein